MKFAQLHYFLSQNVGGGKRYYVPPVQKLGAHVPRPPINLVPAPYDCFVTFLIIHLYSVTRQ